MSVHSLPYRTPIPRTVTESSSAVAAQCLFLPSSDHRISCNRAVSAACRCDVSIPVPISDAEIVPKEGQAFTACDATRHAIDLVLHVCGARLLFCLMRCHGSLPSNCEPLLVRCVVPRQRGGPRCFAKSVSMME